MQNISRDSHRRVLPGNRHSGRTLYAKAQSELARNSIELGAPPLWILRGWAPPNQTGTRFVNREFATCNAELARHPLPRFAIKHAYAHNAPNLARPVRLLRRLLQPVSRQHRSRSTPRRA